VLPATPRDVIHVSQLRLLDRIRQLQIVVRRAGLDLRRIRRPTAKEPKHDANPRVDDVRPLDLLAGHFPLVIHARPFLKERRVARVDDTEGLPAQLRLQLRFERERVLFVQLAGAALVRFPAIAEFVRPRGAILLLVDTHESLRNCD